MKSLNEQTLHELVQKRSHIRHVAVLGEPAQRDALAAALASPEQERDRSSPLVISPHVYDRAEDETCEAFLVNLVEARDELESPGELDAVLALCDGALLIVDSFRGASLLAETALKRTVVSGKPILLVVDGCDEVLRIGRRAEAVKRLDEIVARIQSIVQSAAKEVGTSERHVPVVYGSLRECWGFDSNEFAAAGAKMSEENEETPIKATSTHRLSGILGRHIELLSNFQALRDFSSDDHSDPNLSQHSPIAKSIFEQLVLHIPSPLDCTHDLIPEDRGWWVTPIHKCDHDGPLIVQVVKVIDASPTHASRAVGRVLSGNVSANDEPNVLVCNAIHEDTLEPHQLFYKDTMKSTQIRVKSVGLVAHECFDIPIPAGNLCMLVGVSDTILKRGIVTTLEQTEFSSSLHHHHLFQPPPIRHSVRVTVRLVNDRDRSSLIRALKTLMRLDLSVICYHDYDGDFFTIAATSDLQLESCLVQVRSLLGDGSLQISETFLFYRETVLANSSMTCLVKSPNKHIRFWATAEPLNSEVVSMLQEIQPSARADILARHRLEHEFGWVSRDISHIMSDFIACGQNLLVDQIDRLVPFPLVKPIVAATFAWTTVEGVLCQDPLEGVRLNLVDGSMKGSGSKWSQGQVVVAVRRLVRACQLVFSPALMEPVLLVEIHCKQEHVDACMAVVKSRRGRLATLNDATTRLRVYLPASERLGLNEALLAAAGEPISSQSVLDHFELVEGDPLDASTRAGAVVRAVRSHKQLADELPPLATFLNRL